MLSRARSLASFSTETSADKSAEARHRIESMTTGDQQGSQSAAPLTHQKFAGRKRFYKHVGVENISDNEYRLVLDGRVLRTPGRNPMHFPSKLLALAVAAEWDFQTDMRKGLEPTTMPLTTLASTSIDQVQINREEVIQNCFKYLPTDSALYFTEEHDRILLAKQRKHLSPAIRHLNRNMGVNLEPTTNLSSKIVHDEETIAKFRTVLERMDHFSLACVQGVVMECKSIVLAFSFLSGYLTLEQAKIASRLEEEFQVEIWGLVEGGHDMDRLNNSVNLSAASFFFSLLHNCPEVKQNMIALIDT